MFNLGFIHYLSLHDVALQFAEVTTLSSRPGLGIKVRVLAPETVSQLLVNSSLIKCSQLLVTTPLIMCSQLFTPLLLALSLRFVTCQEPLETTESIGCNEVSEMV